MEKSLGLLIKEGRKKARISLEDLAFKSKISYSTLSLIEAGRTSSTSISNVLKIVDVIELDDNLIKIVCDMAREGNLGEKIRDLRLKKGMTCERLVKLAGIGIGSIYRVERNEEEVRLNTVLSILEVLLKSDTNYMETRFQKFGECVRYFRKKKGITLEKLSKTTGLTVYTICAIEKGKRKKISKDLIDKLAIALDVSLMDYFK